MCSNTHSDSKKCRGSEEFILKFSAQEITVVAQLAAFQVESRVFWGVESMLLSTQSRRMM